jgi:type I restriction enzyme S subunit
MDAQQFLAEFGHFTNAPLGVPRLRELVRRLAVQGKLVAQDSREEPAPRFLERSSPESLGRTYRRTRGRAAPTSASHHELPPGWALVPLDQLAYPQAGFAFKADRFNQGGVGLPIIRVRDVGVSSPATFYSGDYRDEFLVSRGDWLIAMDGDFRVAMWESDAALLNQRVTRLQFYFPEVSKKYVCLALQFELMALQGVKNYTTVDHLSGGQIASARIPLPPVEEQHRIVAKFDELMSLCDQLEQQQLDRRKLQSALRQAVLQALAGAQSPYELQTSWQRLQASFSCLFSEPADVDDFVIELKSLAVRGVLVEAGRTAPDLARIAAECSALRSDYIASGLMRRQKIVGMAESEIAYPSRWAIAAFDEVAVVIGGVTKGRDLRGKQVVVCPYLAVANVQRGYFKLESLKSIEIAEDELPKYQVLKGDLLITEGGDWDKVGRTAIWPGGLERCLHQNHVFKARVPSAQLLAEWVQLVFNSDVGRDYFAGASKQTTNLASINMTQLRSFPLPIPPLEEQRRILDSLAALNDLCEEWRRQLKHRRDLASLFAAASVFALTGINIEQDEDTAVKAPQVELIATLRLGTS